MTNCINCGAPLQGNRCAYCDTEYNNVELIEMDISSKPHINEPLKRYPQTTHDNCLDQFETKRIDMGILKINGEKIPVYLQHVEGRAIFDDPYRDSHGVLHGCKPIVKRKFTLIEI